MAFDTAQPSFEGLRNIVGERTRPLVVWTGSGLSVAAGLPTWPQLRAHLVETLKAKAETFDEDDANRLRHAAQVATDEPNLWIAFQILFKSLGQTTYRESIRSLMAPATDCAIPQSYVRAWRLRPAGMLTLNIDRLASRAFAIERPGVLPVEFAGRQMSRLPSVVNSARPFIGNLHGQFEDSSTWIFQQHEIKSLLKDPSYSTFLQVVLSTMTVLFLGISADDLAIGSLLEDMRKRQVEPAPHYWLTDRRDRATDEWAEAAGIQVIRYRATNGDHAEVDEFFHTLATYVAPDDPISLEPITLSRELDRGELIPDALELRTWDSEDLRTVLNAHAQHLLAGSSAEAYESYSRFMTDYDQAIYSAWYISTKPGKNRLLGYELLFEAAQGAFGRVFKGLDDDGNEVAVKVLHEEIRSNPNLLQSFRRGVRSMQILSSRSLDGMVKFQEASEIPAVVVMEWVDGPNLAQAKEARQLDEWAVILDVSFQLASIVQNAHALPERVLHRDIRPANVMLSGWYSEHDNWKVRVLDFDLSWHVGAAEQSVVYSTAIGYLAPEQIRRSAGVSTRSASVDSFGIGMTLFYLLTGRDPVPEQHRHTDWAETVERAARSVPASAWSSLPGRVSRLIMMATADKQSLRLDVSEIAAELHRLRRVLDEVTPDLPAELVVEELCARSSVLANYQWQTDRATGTTRLPSGIEVEVAANEVDGTIELTISWSSTGVEERRNLRKYIDAGLKTAKDRLVSAGWKITEAHAEQQSLFLRARVPLARAVEDVSAISASIDLSTDSLRFG